MKDDAWSETEKNIKNMEMKLCGAAKALQEERERAAEIEAEVACVRLKSAEVAKIAVKQKNELLDLEEEVAKLKQTLVCGDVTFIHPLIYPSIHSTSFPPIHLCIYSSTYSPIHPLCFTILSIY